MEYLPNDRLKTMGNTQQCFSTKSADDGLLDLLVSIEVD